MRIFASRTAFVLLALGVVASIWSCASSGGGISGTSSIVSGPIQSFGSIVVDDVEFDTTNAEVTIEGDPAELTDLKLGMFVFVRGVVDENGTTGTADRIATDHLIEGPVDSVDAAAGTFVVLDQLVITDAATVFDQATIGALVAGDLVEIFGVLDANASVRATRVEKKAALEEFELTGFITQLDADAETFKIGTLTVDFSSALIENAPAGGLENGLLVEVETDEAPLNHLVSAVGVEVHDSGIMFEEEDSAQLEGFVTSIVSDTEFVLNHGETVFITDATVFEGGDKSDLVLNAHVDVDGALQSDGSLVADEVEFITLLTPG